MEISHRYQILYDLEILYDFNFLHGPISLHISNYKTFIYPFTGGIQTNRDNVTVGMYETSVIMDPKQEVEIYKIST